MEAIKYYRKLLKVSIPILLSSFTNVLGNFVSVGILGHYSIEAMIVVGAANSILIIFNSILSASCIGYRIYFSQALGKIKNQENINSIFCSGLLLTLTISLFISGILLIFTDQFINVITLDLKTASLVKSYLNLIALSYPFQAISIILLLTFSIYEYSKILFYISGISSILNLFLDFVLVYGFFIFPAIGSMGLALATIMTNLFIFVITIIFFIHKNKEFHLKLELNFSYFVLLFKLSYPSIISMFLDYFGNFILFTMMGYYLGTLTLATGRLIFTLTIFCFSIISSMGSGFMILGGKALGGNNKTLFLIYSKYNTYLLLITSSILSLPLLFFTNKTLEIFTIFVNVSDIAYSSVTLLALTLPFLAIYFASASYLRLIKKVKLDMLCNIFTLFFIQVPIAYYLVAHLKIGLVSFAIAFMIHQISYILLVLYIIFRKTNYLNHCILYDSQIGIQSTNPRR